MLDMQAVCGICANTAPEARAATGYPAEDERIIVSPITTPEAAAMTCSTCSLPLVETGS